MLFDPDRHEALCDATWDEARAREAIRAIVRDAEQNLLPEGHWAVHPRDDEGDTPRTGFKSLYLGSAGVWWALWFLQRQGVVQLGRDPAQAIDEVLAAYRAEPDTGTLVPSYYLGEAGILLVQWQLTGSAQAADALFKAVRANITNPTNEALWAAPGTMVAAWQLWEATGEPRWRELFLENVEQLWRTWLFDEAAQCHLWTQDMYGKVVQYLGAGHGFAGNVYPLLRGAAVLDAARGEPLKQRCLATLKAFAQAEGGAVNWRPGTFTPRPGSPRLLMQWCHGAPGIVTALTHFPAGHSAEMEAMLAGAGEAIWQAGPLAKGAGQCHGTAGNGEAFLALYRRTGDALWLARARAFAMHAVVQSDRARAEHGQGRHTLWTGDPGVAVYLWQCIEGRAGMPGLDFLH
jgi:hypothetical protein